MQLLCLQLPWASALALGVLRDVWPLLFSNPEHASGFVQACKLILQRFEDPSTWPKYALPAQSVAPL